MGRIRSYQVPNGYDTARYRAAARGGARLPRALRHPRRRARGPERGQAHPEQGAGGGDHGAPPAPPGGARPGVRGLRRRQPREASSCRMAAALQAAVAVHRPARHARHDRGLQRGRSGGASVAAGDLPQRGRRGDGVRPAGRSPRTPAAPASCSAGTARPACSFRPPTPSALAEAVARAVRRPARGSGPSARPPAGGSRTEFPMERMVDGYEHALARGDRRRWMTSAGSRPMPTPR